MKKIFLIKVYRLPTNTKKSVCQQIRGCGSVEELRACASDIEKKLRERFGFVRREFCSFSESFGMCKGYCFNVCK
jgi:hypothetical protein